MALHYRELEMCAHTNALKYRPDKVPRWSKQQVLERGWQTWQDHDHSCGEKLHKSHGYSNAVGGSEDKDLDSSVVNFWRVLDMPEVRKTIETQVKQLKDQGLYME